MSLPSVILSISGESSSRPYFYSLEQVEAMVEGSVEAFCWQEKTPAYDLAVELLASHPRSDLFLMTWLDDANQSIDIVRTPLRYYDLILLRPTKLFNVSNPEVAERILTNQWQQLGSYLENGTTQLIGLEDFYTNQLASLFQAIKNNGLYWPQVNVLPENTNPALIKANQAWGVEVIAKIGPSLTTQKFRQLRNLGIKSVLININSPVSSLQSQAAAYSDRQWSKFEPLML